MFSYSSVKIPRRPRTQSGVVSAHQASRINPVIEACGGLFSLGKAAVLDPLVAQQVAAGEVVDRLASVVKELSENALDAGATRVEVEIADGGRERMVVRHNGSGMAEEDVKTCVLSHAAALGSMLPSPFPALLSGPFLNATSNDAA
jgi:C4-dicarboxylate-specific signal transduction histidine kinase